MTMRVLITTIGNEYLITKNRPTGVHITKSQMEVIEDLEEHYLVDLLKFRKISNASNDLRIVSEMSNYPKSLGDKKIYWSIDVIDDKFNVIRHKGFVIGTHGKVEQF